MSKLARAIAHATEATGLD